MVLARTWHSKLPGLTKLNSVKTQSSHKTTLTSDTYCKFEDSTKPPSNSIIY